MDRNQRGKLGLGGSKNCQSQQHKTAMCQKRREEKRSTSPKRQSRDGDKVKRTISRDQPKTNKTDRGIDNREHIPSFSRMLRCLLFASLGSYRLEWQSDSWSAPLVSVGHLAAVPIVARHSSKPTQSHGRRIASRARLKELLSTCVRKRSCHVLRSTKSSCTVDWPESKDHRKRIWIQQQKEERSNNNEDMDIEQLA